MKITEYEPGKISCIEGGPHTIYHSSESYCIHCKKTEDELFNGKPEQSSFLDEGNHMSQAEPTSESLDRFLGD